MEFRDRNQLRIGQALCAEAAARLRIHGATRRQVISHFLEIEKPALQPLAPERFSFFRSGQRTIHPDGHVEVEGAFYPAPLHLLGQKIRVRWDRNLVRLYHGDIPAATAILDRFLAHAEVVQMQDKSYRLHQRAPHAAKEEA